MDPFAKTPTTPAEAAARQAAICDAWRKTPLAIRGNDGDPNAARFEYQRSLHFLLIAVGLIEGELQYAGGPIIYSPTQE